MSPRPTYPQRTSHRRRPRRQVAVKVLLSAAALVLLLGSGAWALSIAVPSTGPAPAAAAPVATVRTASPLEIRRGVVTAVLDGQTVQLDGVPLSIPVDGLAAPTGEACGAAESTAFARAKLLGQRVTLVPDPELPDAGKHVVLPSQLSYTDAALLAGMAKRSPGAWTYGPVFDREQAEAADAERGLWATCWDAS